MQFRNIFLSRIRGNISFVYSLTFIFYHFTAKFTGIIYDFPYKPIALSSIEKDVLFFLSTNLSN